MEQNLTKITILKNRIAAIEENIMNLLKSIPIQLKAHNPLTAHAIKTAYVSLTEEEIEHLAKAIATTFSETDKKSYTDNCSGSYTETQYQNGDIQIKKSYEWGHLCCIMIEDKISNTRFSDEKYGQGCIQYTNDNILAIIIQTIADYKTQIEELYEEIKVCEGNEYIIEMRRKRQEYLKLFPQLEKITTELFIAIKKVQTDCAAIMTKEQWEDYDVELKLGYHDNMIKISDITDINLTHLSNFHTDIKLKTNIKGE